MEDTRMAMLCGNEDVVLGLAQAKLAKLAKLAGSTKAGIPNEDGKRNAHIATACCLTYHPTTGGRSMELGHFRAFRSSLESGVHRVAITQDPTASVS